MSEKILLVDDLLATGGTAASAIRLIEKQGAHVVEGLFVIHLTGLGGDSRLAPVKVTSLMEIQG